MTLFPCSFASLGHYRLICTLVIYFINHNVSYFVSFPDVSTVRGALLGPFGENLLLNNNTRRSVTNLL